MSGFLQSASASTVRRGGLQDNMPSCFKCNDSAPYVVDTTKSSRTQHTVVTTFRLKVKAERYPWLQAAAAEVNQVWNWANATSFRAAFPFAAPGKWLSGYDLDRLCVGASAGFEHIASDTIQRVNAEFARRRGQFKKAKLRWRVSFGARRSLGWVPFKAGQLKRKGRSLRFCGKSFRVFERDRLEGIAWNAGCFAEDAVGEWWLCLPVEQRLVQAAAASHESVGLDLARQNAVATSDDDRLEAGQFYRGIEEKIALARRCGHKRRAKCLRRTAERRRSDALHKFSRKIVNRYQIIVIGDVSSHKLAKTRMATPALNPGWGMLKTQLQYKGQQAGRSVVIVNENYTTRVCSSCKASTGSAAVRVFAVRTGVCSECGDTHDRDNVARNTPAAGRCPPSVRGNESPPTDVPPIRKRTPATTRTPTVAA